jgi:hypothetical protein
MKKYHHLEMKKKHNKFVVHLVSEMINASEYLAGFKEEDDAHRFVEIKMKELGVEFKETMFVKFVLEEKK